MTSILCGVVESGRKDFGRLEVKSIFLYALTGLRVSTGLMFVNLLEPGKVDESVKEQILGSLNNDHASKVEGAIENAENGLENLLHIFHRMVPTNIFKAAVEGQLLGLIFFSLLFGYFISKLPADAKDLQIRFWESFNSVILGITKFIISFAPYGVFALVTPTIMQVGLDTLWVMGFV